MNGGVEEDEGAEEVNGGVEEVNGGVRMLMEESRR